MGVFLIAHVAVERILFFLFRERTIPAMPLILPTLNLAFFVFKKKEVLPGALRYAYKLMWFTLYCSTIQYDFSRQKARRSLENELKLVSKFPRHFGESSIINPILGFFISS